MSNAYIAIDLGAESGRVIVGVLANDRLQLEEAHRFAHESVWLPTGLHWDITGIWREIVAGLRRATAWTKANGATPVSVGVDTWGVDWALVDSAGELIGLPHAYRDPRNTAAYEEVIAKLGRDRIYQTTGIQFMALNTLYSLYAHKLADPEAVANGQLLFMPDLFHFWLSGQSTIEATIASTSQMVDCHTGEWADAILTELGLPIPKLRPTTKPGDEIGPLRKKLAEDAGLPMGMRVVAPASHDTASAVAAVPAEPASTRLGHPATGMCRVPGPSKSASGINWCYLSSGTWSLLGAEIDKPCVTSAAQAASFTNERGVAGTIRCLKNIPGLWLVQECRRDFARQNQEMDYTMLTRLANEAHAFRTLVDPAHETFQSPGDMPRKIAEFARATGQPAPQSPGQFVRSCLESLALAYREKLETLEAILGRHFDVIHIVGGGGKNALLSQMTADATGRRVVVGPYEATASGNALVQAMAAREVGSLAELRRIVAQSFNLVEHEPVDDARWHQAYERFRSLSAV